MVEQVLVEAAAARIDHMVTNHIDHTVDQLDTVVQNIVKTILSKEDVNYGST